MPFINLALGAGIWNELLDSRTHRVSPGGRADSVGTTVRCLTAQRNSDLLPVSCRTRHRWQWATETAQKLVLQKPASALQACKAD